MRDGPHEAVRRRRLAAGLRQEELARRAGVSVRTIRNLERRRVTAPRDDVVRRLLAVLDEADPQRPTSLSINVLGPLSIHHGARVIETSSRRLRHLLALLALYAPHPVGRADIVDLLWDGEPPRTCDTLVNTYVARLRGLLEPDRLPRRAARTIVPAPGGYRLDVGPGSLDLLTFDDLFDRGTRAAGAGDHAGAYHLLAEALDCWRGPLLAGTGLVRHPAAVALTERRLSAATAYADAGLALSEYGPVIDRLRPLVERESLHEGLHARLMLALAATGRQAAAVQLHGDLRARLVDGLGISPGPAVQDAYLRVLRQDVGSGPAAGDAAATPVVVPPAQLPARDPNFVGRGAQLARLDTLAAAVDRRDGPVVCAVTGPAGVGKTALVLRWAHLHRDRFPDGQLYVDLRGFDRFGTPADPADALGDFLTALGVAPQAVPATLAARAALYRSLSSGRRLLVVLDNAGDTGQVRPLLPGSAGCLVVVTSRHNLIGLVAGGAARVALGLMPADEGAALVTQRVGRHRRVRDPPAVARIVERCGRLPLALTIVAARAAMNRRLSLTALAAELADSRGGLDALDGGDAGTDARAVFSWSYRRLDPLPARMFRLLGLVPGPDVTVAAAASLAGTPATGARAALSALARVHLVDEHAPGRYAMHDLLRRYAGELAAELDPAPDRATAVRRYLRHHVASATWAATTVMPAAPPSTVELSMRWYDAERDTLLAAVRQATAQRLDAEVCDLVAAMTELFDRQGHWHDWASTVELAQVAAARLADPLREARLHRSRARAEVWLGRFAAARVHLGHAIRLYASLGGRVEARTELAHTHRTLAWCRGRQGAHRDAVDSARTAVALHAAVGDLAGQGLSLNTLGWQYAQLAAYGSALRYCSDALVLLERAGDPNGAGYAHDSLGFVHHRTGDHTAAIRHYRSAATLLHRTGDLYQEGDTLVSLGEVCATAGDPPRAVRAWQRAAELFEHLRHPRADEVRTMLARLRSAPPVSDASGRGSRR